MFKFLFLSLSLVSCSPFRHSCHRTKKKKGTRSLEGERRKTAVTSSPALRNVHKWHREKVSRREGRASRVTNLTPSSNQSLRAGMLDTRERARARAYDRSHVTRSCRIYWTRLKTRMDVHSRSSDLVCVCTINESRKVICLVIEMPKCLPVVRSRR